MLGKWTLAVAMTLAVAGPALADPIVGNWKTDSGATAQIAASGGGFTITLRSGQHNGKRIGQMQASGSGKYKGTITDPAEDKSYSGNATLDGNRLAMQGCVAMVFCRTQNWQRQ
ncbi:DUF2147 domain-containing protein [Mesorhizobium sp. CAU 1741]|uniref:DUF2147 domain-containing protein n=1 Tax=Mesorhizobium sp. CAU 1741 TaxID=3140366 RepID=UPI00325C2BE4